MEQRDTVYPPRSGFVQRRINRVLRNEPDLCVTWSRESLRTNGSRKSLVGSRRESSKRGRVGDQEPAVVLKWQRKDAGLPNNEGDSLRGRRKGAKRKDWESENTRLTRRVLFVVLGLVAVVAWWYWA